MSSSSVRRVACAAFALLSVATSSLPASADQRRTQAVAEHYRLRIEFHQDGTFTETFDGVMADLEAAAKLAKDPGKKAEIENKMRVLAERATSTADRRTVRYVGDGRFEVHTVTSMKLPKPGRKVPVGTHTNVFLIAQGDTVAYVHEAFTKDVAQKMDKAELTETAVICAVTDLPVVESDANEAPKEPGGCYSWRRDATKDTPLRFVVRRPDVTGGK